MLVGSCGRSLVRKGRIAVSHDARGGVEVNDGGMIERSAGRWLIGCRRHSGLVRPTPELIELHSLARYFVKIRLRTLA